MTDIRLSRDYPHPPAKVWRALTTPALMALWGMRPEGFAPVVGTRFQLIGKANPGWRGFIEGEVLEAREPSRLSFSWIGNADDKPTRVTYTLEASALGTRLIYEHTGFTGVGGFIFSKLLMTPGMKQMLDVTFPAVLSEIDDAGTLRSGSTLAPKF
jgi:uncharacterized protein YndB with AHSA1/START domain